MRLSTAQGSRLIALSILSSSAIVGRQLAALDSGSRPSRIAPTFLPNILVDTASGQIAISLGLRGPNYAPVSACATGSHAIGEAAEIIKRDDADAILAGGAESSIHPLILAGFCAMRGLVVEDEDPTLASRPLSKIRVG